MNKTYKFTAGGIQCLFCDNISHNVHDIDEKYCGFCKKFHSPLPPAEFPLEIAFRPSMYDRVFTDSPDGGHPDCKCSHCAQVIEDAAIRIFTDDNREYRYHLACLGQTEIEDFKDDDLPY